MDYLEPQVHANEFDFPILEKYFRQEPESCYCAGYSDLGFRYGSGNRMYQFIIIHDNYHCGSHSDQHYGHTG